MQKYNFYFVFSKNNLENILIDAVAAAAADNVRLDWDEFADCFRSLGDHYKVTSLPGGGRQGADILRFTINRSSIWPWFLAAPGASNGVFTAIFRVTSDGRVAVVRRGGKIEWLK
ncbi:hypothetical protein [Roseibium sp.]|uniref:hypothetical protein n=1 Tax=Roseibium sp. TaxID=1936156 RepID=UPI003A96A6D2